ncbi:class I SAM-dependent methyltransferase [Bacteroidota bacterium]
MIKRFYKTLIPEKARIKLIYGLNKFIAPMYYGNRFSCNCCRKSFNKLLPKGNIKRENAQCPYCGSLERTRLLHFYLQNETELFKKHIKVLHVAPENCLFKIFKKLDLEYIDCDINPAYSTYRIDITKIPFPDNYFDIIICSHVLGHVPDETKAVSELRRVLKDNGIALIMTLINPNLDETLEDKTITSDAERLKSYGESDLFRLHGKDFAQRLKNQKFKVKCIDYKKELSEDIIEHYSLGDGNRELIFECKK